MCLVFFPVAFSDPLPIHPEESLLAVQGSSIILLINTFLFSTELIDFKTRRVAAFRKNLVELAELELKHAKVIVILFDQYLN